MLPDLDSIRNISPVCPLKTIFFLQNCFCLFVKTSSLFLPSLKVLLSRSYEENIICVYDLISDTLCITTPVLDKCVKSIMEGMFTNKNQRKKEKNVFKIFANTKIIDFNHTCKIKHV